MNIYEELANHVDDVEANDQANSIDDFLSDRIKLASLGDLSSFLRLSDDSLVHKSKRDLWKIGENDKGEVVIERLFDPETKEALRI